MKFVLRAVCGFGLMLGMCSLTNAQTTWMSVAQQAQTTAISDLNAAEESDDTATDNYNEAVGTVQNNSLPMTVNGATSGTWTGDMMDGYNSAATAYQTYKAQYNQYHPLAVTAISEYSQGIANGNNLMQDAYSKFRGNPNYSGFQTASVPFLTVGDDYNTDSLPSSGGLAPGGCLYMESDAASNMDTAVQVMWTLWQAAHE